MPDTENHTLKLLQEMRKEMNARFDEVDARFDSMNNKFRLIDTRLDGLDQRLAGTTYMLSRLAGSMSGHETRIEALEAAVKPPLT